MTARIILMKTINLPKILIVDDNANNLFALEALLEDMDLEILQATSGNEALILVAKHDLALILLDVQMPDMDGYEMASIMGGVEKMKNIPIVFVTANSNTDKEIFKGYSAGAGDYLAKPVNEHDLFATMSTWLYQKHFPIMEEGKREGL